MDSFSWGFRMMDEVNDWETVHLTHPVVLRSQTWWHDEDKVATFIFLESGLGEGFYMCIFLYEFLLSSHLCTLSLHITSWIYTDDSKKHLTNLIRMHSVATNEEIQPFDRYGGVLWISPLSPYFPYKHLSFLN